MSLKIGNLVQDVGELASKAKADAAKATSAVKNVVANAETTTKDAFATAKTAASTLTSELSHVTDSPYATAHDGFVAFDPSNGNVVGGRQPGAVLKDLDVPHSPIDNALGFVARPESGTLNFTLPNGKVVSAQAGSNGEGSMPLTNVSGMDPKKGGLMSLGVSTPNGRGDSANVLALPKNYDGPVFVCDIDDTLRATKVTDLVTGKTQAPIDGAKELLQSVAAQGVPIVYLSAGTSSMHGMNEAFLEQLPKGVLLDRQSVGLKGLDPLNSAQAEVQGAYKSQVLGQLKTTFPNVKLFGLGDDKYGDASAYTRAGATTYIHDVKPDHSNLPADFHGTLTPSYTPQFIAKVAGDLKAATAQSASFGGKPAPKADWMQTLSSQLDATTGSKVTQGNSMQLLVDGENALPQVQQGLDSAKKSICYETYNFLPGDPVAEQVASKLIAAQKRGVQVRVVVDAVGAREFPLHSNPTVQKLIAAGVQVKSYNPIDSISDADPNRDHRKDIVIDGSTAFIGGMNTSAQWMGGPNTPGRWHDLFSKVQGPATNQIANAFASSWKASGGTPFDVSSLGTPVAKAGDVPMRVITHTPGQDQNIRSAYLALIDHATKSINVENSFPMEQDVEDALVAAAQRGVNVRYIVGSDQGLLGDANRTRFQTLLDAGVHVYVYPTRVHTKSISVDGQACTIGSSNLDTIALSHNREIINLIQDPATTAKFDQAVFDKDVIGDPQGAKTLELPPQLHDSIWTKLKDGILNAVWPDSLQ